MKRAPLGSGLCFFFIDPDTKQISESHWFYMNHTTPQALLENLETLAKEFKKGVKRMIKIIKSGTIQEKHCERCGCIFSFEEEDIETEVNVGIMYGDKKTI